MATTYQNALIALQKKEAKQGYDDARWNRDYQAGQLKTGAMNNMLSRGMARSSVLGSTINQGMIPIEKQYSQAGQAYQNALARLALEQKYGGSGGGGGGRRVPLQDPPAVSQPGVPSSVGLGQAVATGIVPWQAAGAYTGYTPSASAPTTTTKQSGPSVRYDWWNHNV